MVIDESETADAAAARVIPSVMRSSFRPNYVSQGAIGLDILTDALAAVFATCDVVAEAEATTTSRFCIWFLIGLGSDLSGFDALY